MLLYATETWISSGSQIRLGSSCYQLYNLVLYFWTQRWYVFMLQVEIVCNEHVIHPFRTMKFIWISEWLGKVIMYFCIFCLSMWVMVKIILTLFLQTSNIHQIDSCFLVTTFPKNSITPFSTHKHTHNPQFLQSLWWRANPQKVSFETL